MDPGRRRTFALAAIAAEPESIAALAMAPLVLPRGAQGVVAAARKVVGTTVETAASAEGEGLAFIALPPMRLARGGWGVQRDDIAARAVVQVRRTARAFATRPGQPFAAAAPPPASFAWNFRGTVRKLRTECQQGRDEHRVRYQTRTRGRPQCRC